MMTPQEIDKLPPAQRKKVIDSFAEEEKKPIISEEEFLKMLFAEGIIGNIPNPDCYTDEDDDFEPIEISGKPTSEIIIEERR